MLDALELLCATLYSLRAEESVSKRRARKSPFPVSSLFSEDFNFYCAIAALLIPAVFRVAISSVDAVDRALERCALSATEVNLEYQVESACDIFENGRSLFKKLAFITAHFLTVQCFVIAIQKKTRR